MGFFRADFDRPGPGIPKDAPPSKGLRLFMEILGREFIGLVILNLCFLCCCLPLFVLLFFQGSFSFPLWVLLALAAALPVGPAAAALSRVTCSMVRDLPIGAFRDFWRAFRENFRQGALFGLPSVACILVMLNLLLSLLTAERASSFSFSLLMVSAFLLHAVGLYLFPLIANIQLPAGTILSNAVLLAFMGIGRTLAASLLVGGLQLAALFFFPYSAFFMVLLHFSFCSLLSSLWVWPVIRRYAVKDPQDPPQV